VEDENYLMEETNLNLTGEGLVLMKIEGANVFDGSTINDVSETNCNCESCGGILEFLTDLKVHSHPEQGCHCKQEEKTKISSKKDVVEDYSGSSRYHEELLNVWWDMCR
jgi:hypothetical protein